jgi:hypothetical protein
MTSEPDDSIDGEDRHAPWSGGMMLLICYEGSADAQAAIDQPPTWTPA